MAVGTRPGCCRPLPFWLLRCFRRRKITSQGPMKIPLAEYGQANIGRFRSIQGRPAPVLGFPVSRYTGSEHTPLISSASSRYPRKVNTSLLLLGGATSSAKRRLRSDPLPPETGAAGRDNPAFPTRSSSGKPRQWVALPRSALFGMVEDATTSPQGHPDECWQ